MALVAITKPTHDCNLACRYCYVDENAESGTMDSRTLETSISKIVEFNGKDANSHFLWHGGEPLLLGVDFFKEVVDIQKRFPEYNITNAIQSNGTLLTEDMADFCREYGFHIGLSLDGPQQMHDSARPYKNGEGSYHDVMRAVKLASDRKIGGGAISILTKENIDHLEEVYQFFRDNRIHVKINPLIRSGNAIENYEDLSIKPREYGHAMNKLFDMWFYEPEHKIDIDPFDQIIGNIITGVPFGCDYSDCQKSFVSIGPQGDVYPCGRFDGIPEFHLGNINEDDLHEMLESSIRQQIIRRADEIKSCQPCDYKKMCNSGCVHNAYMVRGNIMDRDYYCVGYKMMFRHFIDVLHKELKKAEVGDRYARKLCKA